MAVEAKELAKRLRKPPDMREPREWQRAMLLLAEAVEKLPGLLPWWVPEVKKEAWLKDWLRRVAEATKGGEGHER